MFTEPNSDGKVRHPVKRPAVWSHRVPFVTWSMDLFLSDFGPDAGIGDSDGKRLQTERFSTDMHDPTAVIAIRAHAHDSLIGETSQQIATSGSIMAAT